MPIGGAQWQKELLFYLSAWDLEGKLAEEPLKKPEQKKWPEKKKRNSFESLFITCKKLKPTQYSQTVSDNKTYLFFEGCLD